MFLVSPLSKLMSFHDLQYIHALELVGKEYNRRLYHDIYIIKLARHLLILGAAKVNSLVFSIGRVRLLSCVLTVPGSWISGMVKAAVQLDIS